jgi:hypothetical protein
MNKLWILKTLILITSLLKILRQSLLCTTISFVEDLVEDLLETVEDFEALFNDPETKEDLINDLLNAWNAYQSLSDELKDEMDPETRARLETLYARYLELSQPSSEVNLVMISLIIVHLAAGTYFAFKKRDVLVPIVE